MKKIARLLMMSCVVAICLTVMISLSFAQPQPKVKGPVDTEKLQKPIPVPLPDLVVTDIYGGQCLKCTGFDLETMFGVVVIKDVYVKVENKGRGSSIACKLKVEFFDVAGGWFQRSVTLDVGPINAGGYLPVKAFSGDYMFRKRTGIKATVDSTNLVAESNEGNNSKTVYECHREGPI